MMFIIKCFRQLKMKEQVIIVDFFITSLILLIIMGTYFIQSAILFAIIQNSSQAIAMKQERRSIQYSSVGIHQYLERKYFQSILNTYHVDIFFQTMLSNKQKVYNISNQLFQSCVALNDIGKQQIKYNSNLFCYQSLVNDDGITFPDYNGQIDFFNQTASIISQYSLLFDATFDSMISFLNLPEPQLMCSYPQFYQFKNFNISERPWFINYQKMHDEKPDLSYYYSPLYVSVQTYEYSRALTTSIHNLEKSVIGMVRITLQLTDNNIADIPINVILTDDNGEVILSSMDKIKNEAKQRVFIQNETQTGFNESDWNLIQKYTTNISSSPQLCDGYADTFCLYNKLFNKSVQVNVREFKNEQYNLIVFVNVTFEAELTLKFNELTNNLLNEIIRNIQIQIICCAAVIILTAILIHLIFLPLYKLMENVIVHIRCLGNNLNAEIFKMMNKRKKPSNIFSDLTIRFLTLQDLLTRSQTQKCALCLQIESLHYSIKASDLDYFSISSKVQSMGTSTNSHQYFCSTKNSIQHLTHPNQLEMIQQTLIKQHRMCHTTD